MTELKNTQQAKQLTVLLIGDSCIDEYCYGTVSRLSPEAPVPVLQFRSTTSNPGMAANVYKNLLAFGVEVDFMTNGEKIKKVRYVDVKSGQNLLRTDYDVELLPWSGYLATSLDEYDAVVISDYNKGFVTYEAIERIIKSATCPVFIDTKKQDLSRFSADHVYVKINELEYRNRFSIPKNLVVTLGDRGAMLKQYNHEKIYSTGSVEVMDVCGCGDTFLAALSYQYLNTNSIEQAIDFANRCSAITVGHRGVYSLTRDDIAKVDTK